MVTTCNICWFLYCLYNILVYENKKDAVLARNLEFNHSIDILNFSLSFKVGIIDLDEIDLDTDYVSIQIKIFYDQIIGGHLVKFTKIKVDREVFWRVIKMLGEKAGEYLSGIDSNTQKKNCSR